MSKTKVIVQQKGMGALGLLGIIFVIAKLTGYIAWSWWLVLLPFYLGLAIVFGVLAVVGIGVAVASFVVVVKYYYDGWKAKRNRKNRLQ